MRKYKGRGDAEGVMVSSNQVVVESEDRINEGGGGDKVLKMKRGGGANRGVDGEDETRGSVKDEGTNPGQMGIGWNEICMYKINSKTIH